MRLMSSCCVAMSAASTAVMMPMAAITVWPVGESWMRNETRASM